MGECRLYEREFHWSEMLFGEVRDRAALREFASAGRGAEEDAAVRDFARYLDPARCSALQLWQCSLAFHPDSPRGYCLWDGGDDDTALVLAAVARLGDRISARDAAAHRWDAAGTALENARAPLPAFEVRGERWRWAGAGIANSESQRVLELGLRAHLRLARLECAQRRDGEPPPPHLHGATAALRQRMHTRAESVLAAAEARCEYGRGASSADPEAVVCAFANTGHLAWRAERTQQKEGVVEYVHPFLGRGAARSAIKLWAPSQTALHRAFNVACALSWEIVLLPRAVGAFDVEDVVTAYTVLEA
jgi:hypothetical protein